MCLLRIKIFSYVNPIKLLYLNLRLLKIYNLIFNPYSKFLCCPYNVLYSYFFPHLVISMTFCFGISLFSFKLIFFSLFLYCPSWRFSPVVLQDICQIVSSWPNSDQAFFGGILQWFFVSFSVYHIGKYMISLCSIIDHTKFDHLAKFMSIRFFHYKGTIFSL